MKKRKTRVTKKLTIKRGISPTINDTIKTEEIKFDRLPSECDIVDIPIKQEEPNLEVKQYDIAFDQSLVRFHDTIESNLSLGEQSIDSNRMEELNTNTTELSRQSSCHHCSLLFTYERLYIDHVNEVHRLESNTQQFHCQTCDTTFMGLDNYHNHLRQVHRAKLQPLIRKRKSKSNSRIEPELNDPNFYCKFCSTEYQNLGKFRKHIRDVHKIVLELLIKTRKLDNRP